MFRNLTRIAAPAAAMGALLAGGWAEALDFSPALQDLIKKANAEGRVHTSWN